MLAVEAEVLVGKVLGGHERECKRIEMGLEVFRENLLTPQHHGASPSLG
jgi:hypothetical protein